MKNLNRALLALFLITINYAFIYPLQRRAGTSAARRILTRTSATRPSASITCPAGTKTSKSFFTKSSVGDKAKAFGTRTREFGKKHPKKLLAAGTAGVAGAGISWP